MKKQALNYKRGTVFKMPPEDVIVIGIDEGDKKTPGYDPRVLKPLREDTVENIATVGVIEPIVVRKDGPNRVVVVDGRRRTLHARKANEVRAAAGLDPILVPVIVKTADDRFAHLLSLSLNEHRENDDARTKSQKIAFAIEELGATEEEVALHANVTVATVQNWLRLAGCVKEVYAAIDANLLSPTAASQLGDLSRDDQLAQLEELTEGGTKRATVTKARAAAKKAKTGTRANIAMSKKQLRRVVKWSDENPCEIEDTVIKTIRWMLGEIDSSSIRGITAALKEQ